MDKVISYVKKLLGNRSLKYGTNAVVLTAVVVAIAVVINLMVGTLAIKWDLTENKLYSIGDTTKTILSTLNKDITVYGLFDEANAKSDPDMQKSLDLLEQYKKNSHIKVEFVDPDKKPGFIKELDKDNIKGIQTGDFVFKCGNKIKRLEKYDLINVNMDYQNFTQTITGSKAEEAFTGAIKYVTADKTPVVYFTEGHGEKKVDSDYTKLRAYLDRNNYEVKTINLVSNPKVPADAEILVVASPQNDLALEERERLKEYLYNGGKTIFLFDAMESNTKFAGFEDVLKDYNIGLGYDKIKETDEQRHLPKNQYGILLEVQRNSIFDKGFGMLLNNSRSVITLKNQKEYIEVTPLLKTSDKAVSEKIDKTKGADTTGELDVAVAVENKGNAKPSKVLVLGNSGFISDNAESQYGSFYENGSYFFINALGWMQDKKDDVLIAPKSYSPPTLDKITQTSVSVTSLMVVVILPLLIFGAGTFVWMRRRHL